VSLGTEAVIAMMRVRRMMNFIVREIRMRTIYGGDKPSVCGQYQEFLY